MPEAVDVGSVLGGRYRVSAHVLTSAQQDHVLDGVDEVLNRPVSILVASQANAGRLTDSARDLAAADRDERIQVLDLLITDTGTSLVTNRAPAAVMLKLVGQQEAPPADEPAEDPFVEPFPTDTLGFEIFGTPRSTEPETCDDDEEDHEPARRWSGLAGFGRRFGRRSEDEHDDATGSSPVDDDAIGSTSVDRDMPGSAPDDETTGSVPVEDDASASVSVDADPPIAARLAARPMPPPPARRPIGYTAGTTETSDAEVPPRAAATAVAVGSIGAAPAGRTASHFPFFSDEDDAPPGNRPSEQSGDSDDDGDDGDDDRHSVDDRGGDGGGRTVPRILLGTVLSIVLVIAVILVATQLSSLFRGTGTAGEQPQQGAGTAPAQAPTNAPPPASAAPAPEVVVPVIAGISRVVPDNPALDAGNDVNLPQIIDGDPTTSWGNQVYASDTFGGLASNLALVVELEEESTVSEVTIEQLDGTGGGFAVLVNDEPTIDGAEEVARGSFTSPTITLPVPADGGRARTARYVIVDVTQLPRLSNIQAQFPFGLRIAEIDVG